MCGPFEKLNVKKTSLSERDMQKFSGQKMPQRIQKNPFCPLEIIKRHFLCIFWPKWKKENFSFF
jgi:hypothetical protein